MYSIYVGSQKGGVGKSSLCRALAYAASKAKKKFKVKLVDLDPGQGTVSEWARRRAAAPKLKPVASVEVHGTAEAAFNSAIGFDLLIIDGPARASKGTLDIAKKVDLFIHPLSGAYDDIHPAVILFNELAAKVPINRLAFLLYKIGTQREFEEAKERLDGTPYHVLKNFIYNKSVYSRAQDRGKTILETSYRHLNQQVETVIDEITSLLTEV